MRTTQRSYSEVSGDFNRLCRFVAECNDHTRTHSTWSLGRLVDWKYGLYENKTSIAGFCDKNAHLWFNGFGELASFAISESGDAGFTIITREGYRFLFEEILQWVLANWSARGSNPSTEITEFQTREAQILERCGFSGVSTFSRQCFDLTMELAERSSLEHGFTIVDMHSHPDFRGQRILRDNAFKGDSTVSEEELNRELMFYNHIHEGPIYHPECDLCVMAEDGRFIAGCEALIDAWNAEADIERVCTHSDFRRRGFARAVIQECLYRLRDMGMRQAFLSGYSPEAIALYDSLGHTEELSCSTYERTIS